MLPADWLMKRPPRRRRGRAPSWWFARLFAELHLVRGPRVDPDAVAAEKPDRVICQTVERFLRLVPGR